VRSVSQRLKGSTESEDDDRLRGGVYDGCFEAAPESGSSSSNEKKTESALSSKDLLPRLEAGEARRNSGEKRGDSERRLHSLPRL
jgi:hypothetical protein